MFKNHSIVWQIILALVLIQGMMWGLVLKNTRLPPQVPLWYYQPQGQAQLADPFQLWLLPGLTAASLAVSLPLALYFYSRQRKLGQLLVFSSLLISLLSSWALFVILSRIGVV